MRALNLTCIRDGHAPYRDLIYDQGGSLRVQVFNMQAEFFQPSAGELHYFGDNFGDELAFETIGYRGENEQDVESMVRWYAGWIGYPHMKIFRRNP